MGWSRPSGTLAFLRALPPVQDSDLGAPSPGRRGTTDGVHDDGRRGDDTVRSQSSEVAYLRSENRFLYDGSLFFFFLKFLFKIFLF